MNRPKQDFPFLVCNTNALTPSWHYSLPYTRHVLVSQLTTTLYSRPLNLMGGGSAQTLRNPRDHRCHQIVTDWTSPSPLNFTSNIHEAYQRQINSQFLDPVGNQTRDPCLKDKHASE